MLEVKVKVTFDDEIKELLSAILKLAKVDVPEVAEVEDKGLSEGDAVLSDSLAVVEDGGKKCDITIGDIRDIATKLIAKNKRSELKEVLSSLGVMRIVDIEKGDYSAVHDRLTCLLHGA